MSSTSLSTGLAKDVHAGMYSAPIAEWPACTEYLDAPTGRRPTSMSGRYLWARPASTSFFLPLLLLHPLRSVSEDFVSLGLTASRLLLRLLSCSSPALSYSNLFRFIPRVRSNPSIPFRPRKPLATSSSAVGRCPPRSRPSFGETAEPRVIVRRSPLLSSPLLSPLLSSSQCADLRADDRRRHPRCQPAIRIQDIQIQYIDFCPTSAHHPLAHGRHEASTKPERGADASL
ncbi:hypothetical protein CDD80_2035 [Ophiocordyceps camponoti-rufipedis]|uniref:Uncharacterized protein n=1 Tax=Ophiocordyceps camponoti-rufipedis TaxID=2004952 RepID=A0A2C5Z753_9HYPO|nr:hypothetical protein CDD80_2035 [Ophiocordyceps camponoti-rufipedis]